METTVLEWLAAFHLGVTNLLLSIVAHHSCTLAALFDSVSLRHSVEKTVDLVQSFTLLFLLVFFFCVVGFVGAHACMHMSIDIRDQLVTVYSVLLPCEG